MLVPFFQLESVVIIVVPWHRIRQFRLYYIVCTVLDLPLAGNKAEPWYLFDD